MVGFEVTLYGRFWVTPEVERYQKMLDTCGVSPEAQANIFGGTMRRILDRKQ